MMSFGKFVLLSISSVALLLLGASQAAALNSLELSPTAQTINIGDQVDISLTMNFADAVSGGGLEVSYDGAALSFVSFVFDELFTGNFGLTSSPDGATTNPITIGFGFFTMVPPYGFSGEQVVGTMTFEALPTGSGTTSTVATGASSYLPGPFYGPADPFAPMVISYGSTQVTVANPVPVVPEPSTALLLLVGLAGLSYRPVRKD